MKNQHEAEWEQFLGSANEMADQNRSADGRRLSSSSVEGEQLLTRTSMFEHAVRLEENRGEWSKKLDYLLSMIGYSVGLSNIWRFPYLCYQNGGGAFLIPYIIFLFVCGIPLFFMESSMGQFTSRSAATLWSICPIFKGVGWATIIITLIVSTYFNVILAYGLLFLFESLTANQLPWSSCNHYWNTDNCLDYNNLSAFGAYHRYLSWRKNGSHLLEAEEVFDQFINGTITSPSEEFFYNRVLNMSSGIEELGGLVGHLVPCLFVAWLITMACLVKGVKSSGKVVYFTATFPYVLLTILLVRGLTLEGAFDGIAYYVRPNFTRLREPRVWSDAAFQVFFSLGPGWGGLITMGSYNQFENNCLKDSYMLPIIMELTSFYAGFVVFSVLGFMAHTSGKNINEVVAEGPGLAFITYPEVVARMPLSQFWSALFFLMVVSVGVDSVFVMVETAITAAHDELMARNKYHVKRVYILAAGCLSMFLCGLVFITRGGMYILHLVDQYCAFVTVIVICIIELVSFAWIYGAERLLSDFEFMLKRKLSPLWAISWRYITLSIVIIIFFVSVLQYSADFKMGEKYNYPIWAIGLGWFTASLSLGTIPMYIVYKLIATPGKTIMERVRRCTRPTKAWGPSNPKRRLPWEAYQKRPEYARSLRDRCAEYLRTLKDQKNTWICLGKAEAIATET